MKNRKALERASMLDQLLPGGDALVWPREHEGGWFKGPRSLPLILAVLNTKHFRGALDIASTYLALLAENWDEGLVEVKGESDAAMTAGFRADARGLRTWRERIRKLENSSSFASCRVAAKLHRHHAPLRRAAAAARQWQVERRDVEPGSIQAARGERRSGGEGALEGGSATHPKVPSVIMTEIALVFFAAASVLFGLNWWEKQRSPTHTARSLPLKAK